MAARSLPPGCLSPFQAMKQTTGIIFISSKVPYGAAPKERGFSYCPEHDKYCFGGRELSVDEFNEAAQVVFQNPNRVSPYKFSVAIISRFEPSQSQRTPQVTDDGRCHIVPDAFSTTRPRRT